MLTIPSIISNPYVHVDVRVLILYYGALHYGMLLSPGLKTSEKTKYSLFFYRKALQLMEKWQLQDQLNELSLHVAFWMVSPFSLYSLSLPGTPRHAGGSGWPSAFVMIYTKERGKQAHEAYSQLDFDLSHRLHGCACQIARGLGLLQLDAENPFPSSFREISPQSSENPRRPAGMMGTVYRYVHRIYFWHILILNDYSFRYHLYRSGNIDSGTWKVGLPDFSTGQSPSNIQRDTEVYFEASLRLSLIELKYSDLENSSVLHTSADGVLSEAEQVKLTNLLLEIVAMLSEWQVVSSPVLLFWCYLSLTITGAIVDADILQSSRMALRSFDLALYVNDRLIPPNSATYRPVANKSGQESRA